MYIKFPKNVSRMSFYPNLTPYYFFFIFSQNRVKQFNLIFKIKGYKYCCLYIFIYILYISARIGNSTNWHVLNQNSAVLGIWVRKKERFVCISVINIFVLDFFHFETVILENSFIWDQLKFYFDIHIININRLFFSLSLV